MADKARNDLSAAVPKFCLALEEHRRTPEGRVRTSQELLASFFPHDDKACTDRIFKYLPNEVRGPIVAAWGIRGIKAALRDTDDKVQQVVHDALVAGDIDHAAFEEGLAPETLVRWVPLADLWAFWRGGKLTKQAIHKALSTAYELYLFDARWFLDTIHAKGGSIKGTDVLAEGLTKDDLTQWIKRIHESGDGTPKGIVAALGWDKIVAKTANDVLVAVLDAMVAKVGLVVAPARESSPRLPDSSAKGDVKSEPRADAKADAKGEPKPDATAASPEPAGVAADGGEAASTTASPPSQRPPDDGAWASTPPPAPNDEPSPEVPAAPEDAIQVVVDDELLIADRSTMPRLRAAAPTGTVIDEEDTEVKQVPRVRSERPPARGPSSRR